MRFLRPLPSMLTIQISQITPEGPVSNPEKARVVPSGDHEAPSSTRTFVTMTWASEPSPLTSQSSPILLYAIRPRFGDGRASVVVDV